MGDIGAESPFPLEGRLQSAQQVVEPFHDRLKFRRQARHGEPLGKVFLAERADSRCQSIQRAEAAANDCQQHAGRDGNRNQADQLQEQPEPGQDRVDGSDIAEDD